MTFYDEHRKMMDAKYGKPITWLKLSKGDKIHLYSIPGTYTVHHVTKNKICITAKTWNYETRYVPNSDFKCLQGGKKNTKIVCGKCG